MFISNKKVKKINEAIQARFCKTENEVFGQKGNPPFWGSTPSLKKRIENVEGRLFRLYDYLNIEEKEIPEMTVVVKKKKDD